MRVFVVRNGHMGGGKHLLFDAGAGLQALIKAAGDALGLQFACLLYTPQGGLVDDLDAIVADDVLYVSEGEDFKNPSIAPGPAPVTLKNMFDESRAHLPAPTPLRKSVEQRLGLKTSTGGKSKADYEAAVLQVSEVFPTYELNMIIAAVTLAKCNLDNAIGMLMEPSAELIARKKLLDDVRGAKERNAMRRSQESIRASREKVPVPNPQPPVSVPAPVVAPAAPAPTPTPVTAAAPAATNVVTTMPPPASRPLKVSGNSAASAAANASMSANFPYKAEFEGLQRHAPPDHYAMIRSILLFTKGDVARTATLYAQWKAKQPAAPPPVVAPPPVAAAPAPAPVPKADAPPAASSASSKFKIDWAPPSSPTPSPAAPAPTAAAAPAPTAVSATALASTVTGAKQERPVELLLTRPALSSSSDDADDDAPLDSLRERCVERIAANWSRYATSIHKLPPRLRLEVFERACICGAAEVSDEPSHASGSLSVLLKRSVESLKPAKESDEQVAKRLQKEQEEALSRRQIADMFARGALAPSQLSSPEALHIAAQLDDAIPDDQVYVSLLGPLSLLEPDVRALFSAGTLQKVLRQEVLGRFRARWNALREKLGAFYEVVPYMAFHSADMGALPALISAAPAARAAAAALHLAADPTSCLARAPHGQTHVSLLVCAVLLGRPLYAPDGRWSERRLAPGYHSHVTSDERFALLFSPDAVAPCYALHIPVDIAADAATRFPSLKRRTIPRVRPLAPYIATGDK